MLGHRPLVVEDYLAILKRRGWMLLVPTLLFPLIAVAITYRLTPTYTSQTLVLIEPQTVPDAYVKPILAQDIDSRLSSMKEQILSRSRLEPIIMRFNLGEANMNMDDKVTTTRKNIGIVPIHSAIQGSGGLPGFFISFTASDPHTAQLVCREITSLFVSENLQAREQSAEGTTQFLKGQLDQAKSNLDSMDAKLAAFQREYMGALPEQQQTNMQMLTTLGTQLDAVTEGLARMEQDKSLEQALLAQESHQSLASGPARVSPQTQQLELQKLEAQEADLTTRYTADYPTVVAIQRQISDLRKQMAQSASAPAPSTAPATSAPQYDSPAVLQLRAQIAALGNAIQQKKNEQAGIQAEIRLYQGRIQSTPMIEAKMKDLTRDHQTAQEFYDSLQTKMNQSQMATDLERRQEGEQFRVMDDANLPDEPTFPNRTKFAIGGAVLGLGLGLLIAALLEYRDKSVRSERDVWAFTKLPTIATIALLPDAKGTRSFKLFGRRHRPEDLNSTRKPLANVGG